MTAAANPLRQGAFDGDVDKVRSLVESGVYIDGSLACDSEALIPAEDARDGGKTVRIPGS